jgi:16S rRNA (guanine966-N2)-methyltransferase
MASPARPSKTLSNQVRIIGGQWRSRIVRFPDSPGLRPTPDRVRETLFNWLGQRLDGLECLDLFAGSGALGFEALSRGASRVVMVESGREAVAALRHSAQALGAQQAVIMASEALAWLKRPAGRFDLAFVDPPYASALLAPALQALPESLKPGARVYCESAEPVAAGGGPWRILRAGRAGAVHFALLAFEPESVVS